MILDNPPNQIARRGALSSGKHLELLEDHLRNVRFDALAGGKPHVGAHRKLARSRGIRA